MSVTLRARHYATGAPVEVRCEDGLIQSVQPSAAATPADTFIAPGFVDLQVNGYGGLDFGSPQLTIDDVMHVTLGLDRHGVTGFLPTITTNSHETIAHALRTIDQACRQRRQAENRILGVHVEGPFISPQDGPRGAHPREHCRPPDWNEFQRWQEAASGRIRLITLSPEYDEAPGFITKAVEAGVLVAIGHTNANTQQIAAAVDAGARMSTHLGNGAHPLIRRHPNYLWDQLADDRLTASIIADGHHLPVNVIKCFVRMKTSERIVLVSDITGMAGMPVGRYQTMLGEVEVLDDGRLVVAGQREILAGAALPIDYCVGHVLQSGAADLKTAVEMASTQPAQLIGVHHHALREGAPANLVVFTLRDGALTVVQTYNRGELVAEAGTG
jgi:N-acetylglucosamine-6-phosphate deacetylase